MQPLPRNSREISLIYRSNRAKLPIERDPHWHLITEGQHLGYRNTGETQGNWVARYYVPGKGRRHLAIQVRSI